MPYPIVLPVPFKAYRGDDCRLEFDLITIAGPVNLAGFGTVWTAQARPSASDATSWDFTVTVDAPNGKISLRALGSATSVWPDQVGFDVQCVDSGQSPPVTTTVVAGTIAVDGEFTRATP